MVFIKDLDSNGTMAHQRETEFQKIGTVFSFLLHQEEAVFHNRSFDSAHVIGFSFQAAFAEDALIGFEICLGINVDRGHNRSSYSGFGGIRSPEPGVRIEPVESKARERQTSAIEPAGLPI